MTKPPQVTRRSRCIAGALIPILSCVLAACGGSANRADQVASLAQPPVATRGSRSHHQATGGSVPGPGRAPSRGARDGGGGARPVERLDDTPQRRTALFNAYSSCLLQHGARPATSGMAPAAAGPGNSKGILVQQPVPAAAKAACIRALPLPPPQLEASTNPHFHTESLAYVGCLRAAGVWVRLLNGQNLNWTFVAGHTVPGDQGAIEQRCLLQSFGSR